MKKLFGTLFAIGLSISSIQASFAATLEKTVKFDNLVATHVIANGNSKVSRTVIMLHGFASSRNEVGGMYKRLADKLAAQGVNSIRIDFRGFGDTSVKSTQATITTMVEDANNTFNYLQKMGVKEISVQGFSLGSEVAIIAFSDNKDIKSMSLWSTPKELMSQYSEITKKDRDIAYKTGVVDLDLGWRKLSLSKAFFESLKKYNVESTFAKFQGDIFFIAGGIDELKDDPFALQKATKNKNIDIFIVKGGDHIYHSLDKDQTQSDLVINKTTDWFSVH